MATRSYATDPVHGKVNNPVAAKRLAALAAPAAAQAVSWGDVEATGILDLVEQVTSAGGAIILGRTRDAQAYAITILLGEEKQRLYASTPMELAVVIQRIQTALST